MTCCSREILDSKIVTLKISPFALSLLHFTQTVLKPNNIGVKALCMSPYAHTYKHACSFLCVYSYLLPSVTVRKCEVWGQFNFTQSIQEINWNSIPLTPWISRSFDSDLGKNHPAPSACDYCSLTDVSLFFPQPLVIYAFMYAISSGKQCKLRYK